MGGGGGGAGLRWGKGGGEGRRWHRNLNKFPHHFSKVKWVGGGQLGAHGVNRGGEHGAPGPPPIIRPLGVEQEGVRDKCTTQNIPSLQLMLVSASDVCKQ